LFQYYLLDTTGFEPNVFTTIFPGINDHVQLTVTGANCGLPTVGAARGAGAQARAADRSEQSARLQ
jgi:hypothetical protein